MNNSARLMTNAALLCRPVLCCGATAEHMRASLLECGAALPAWLEGDNRAPPLRVAMKGTTTPMAVHAPTLPAPALARSGLPPLEPRRSSSGAAMLGREAELARVAEALRDDGGAGGAGAGAGGGVLLLVSGGVSSGKSTFARAAAVMAASAGAPTLALAPAHSAGAFDTPWFAAAAAAAAPELPPPLRPLAPLLAQLAPSLPAAALATPDSAAALTALSSSEAHAALLALTVAVMRPLLLANRASTKRARALLLLDDAARLDARSAAALGAVCGALRPALLLTLPRGQLEDGSSDGAALVRALTAAAAAAAAPTAAGAVSVRVITLGPLPRGAAAALCAAALHVPLAALPHGLVPALSSLGGGHPLLLKEQLALLTRAGMLSVDARAGAVRVACDVAALPEVIARALTTAAEGEEHAGGGGSSARLEIFMQRRLDSLGAGARAAVTAAAVLGGDWDLPLLSRVCGARLSFGAVCTAAAELVQEGMWAHASGSGSDAQHGADDSGGSDDGGAARYTFAHDVVRSLVFAATPEDARAELHAAVLACLEERAAGDGDAAAARPTQPAAAWCDWARLARGAHQHEKAAELFLNAARLSLTRVAAHGLAAAGAAAREGIACLRAAEEAEEQAAEDVEEEEACVNADDTAAEKRTRACVNADDAAAAAGDDDRRGAMMMSSLSSSPASPSIILARGFRRSSTSHGSSAPQHAAAAPLLQHERGRRHSRSRRRGALWRSLTEVLDTVARVQASWTLLEPRLAEHALSMTHEFVRLAPSLLDPDVVRSKGGIPLGDPSMCAIMVAHQATLLRLVGACVAGQKDFEALVPMLLRCGRMHARFGRTMRAFFPACGAAMRATLTQALGDAFTADVEAAWSGVFDFVAAQMIAGIDAAERATATEVDLRDGLLGGGGAPAAVAVVVAAA
jgi:hypothetical protein